MSTMKVLFTFGIIVLAASLCSASENCLGVAMGTAVPNDADCRSYYICNGNGGGQLNNCVAGYFFDPMRKYCRPSSEISCGSGSVTTAPTATPTAAPTASPTVSQTVAPTAAPAVTPTVKPTAAPTLPPTTSGFTGNECKGSNVVNGDLLPYPGDCTRFIQCAYEVPVIKRCPSNLHFNKYIRVCDWPNTAGCI